MLQITKKIDSFLNEAMKKRLSQKSIKLFSQLKFGDVVRINGFDKEGKSVIQDYKVQEPLDKFGTIKVWIDGRNFWFDPAKQTIKKQFGGEIVFDGAFISVKGWKLLGIKI